MTAPVITPERTDVPAPVPDSVPDSVADPDRPWVTVVWNDPVNLMTYVRRVLQRLFGYSAEHAHELMMQVHTEGRSAVATGSHEQVEAHVAALHGYGLWATAQQD